MRVARLPVSEKKKVGMHSLRHTLATTLMEQQTPLQEIADILGHQSTESTPVYLKSSLKLLQTVDEKELKRWHELLFSGMD